MPISAGARPENAVLMKDVIKYFFPNDTLPEISAHLTMFACDIWSAFLLKIGKNAEDPRPSVVRPGHLYSVQKKVEMSWYSIRTQLASHDIVRRKIAEDFTSRYLLAKNGITP